MRRIWSFVFYSLCVFTIVFSLFWMALPQANLPAPSAGEQPLSSQPNVLAQARPSSGSSIFSYYLCDEGGRVAVYACGADGKPEKRLELTGIYVNLLPEGDALRIKHGLTVQSEKELDLLLEDLGR